MMGFEPGLVYYYDFANPKAAKFASLNAMITNRILLILSFITILIVSVTSGPGCANIIPPAGGPADSIPPQLQKADPKDSTLNFRGNRLTFTFDEYVEVQNVQQQLLVSPIPRFQPSVDYRLNTVTVRIKDTLEPNTTYSFDFGQAIKDVNEGNIIRNFRHTFSTGPYLDSLGFSGNVILAETGRIDTSLVVMLHTNPSDSAVITEKPRYVTKLDRQGRFVFRNLPPKTYRVYALKDETGSLRYFDDKNLFAFADAPVTISDSTPGITLYAYANRPPGPATTTTTAPATRRGRNEPVTADRRLKFTTNLTGGLQDLLGDFVMTFEQPLRSYDSTRLSLHTDSIFTPVPAYRLVLDSSRRSLTLGTTWKEGTTYHLILDKDFAEDSMGRRLLKSDTLSFTSRKLSDYGKIKIRFRNLDISKHPVLLFVLNGNITQSFPLTAIDFSRPLFVPGEYELRILYDDNQNGKWAPGIFFEKHQQPELVKPIDRKVIVRANWENEFEIAL